MYNVHIGEGKCREEIVCGEKFRKKVSLFCLGGVQVAADDQQHNLQQNKCKNKDKNQGKYKDKYKDKYKCTKKEKRESAADDQQHKVQQKSIQKKRQIQM